MKDKIRRALAMLLTLAMFVPSLPTTALAAKAQEPYDETAQKVHDKAASLYDGQATRTIGLENIEVNAETTANTQAGRLVKFNVTYTYKSAETYTYDSPQPLYDYYDNNVITVRLPAGMVMNGAAEGYLYTETQNTDGTTTVVFERPRVKAASGSTYEFNFSVFMANNGTPDAVAEYDLTDAITFQSEFTILDKSKDPVEELQTYAYSVTEDLPDVTTTSNDSWMVEKSVQGEPVLSDDNTSVKVTYLVEVGMPGTDGVMLRSLASYNRYGRLPFAVDAQGQPKVALNGDLTATISGLTTSRTSVEPTSVVMYKKGHADQAAAVSENSDVILSDTAEHTWALDTAGVDSTGDGVTANFTQVPAYTQYIVEAVYPIEEDMIDDFASRTGKLNFKNELDLKYTLATKSPATDDAEAAASAKLPIREPAKLTITKKLRDYLGNTNSYANDWGHLFYKIKATDDTTTFALYRSTGTDEYEAVTEAAASHVVESADNGSFTCYLPAGISYTVEEMLTDDQADHMALYSNSNTNDVTPAEKQNWTASFTNREKAGTVTVTKLDDSGLPVKNAKFTLKTASGTEIGTKTTGNNGVVTFQHVPLGSYVLTETVVPTGYAGTYEETFTIADDDEHRVFTDTAVNSRTYATINLNKYVGITEAAASMDMAATNFNKGNFKLQRTLTPANDSSWEDVTEGTFGDLALNIVDGVISCNVPAFDSSKASYWYRFYETLPEGYYDPAAPGQTFAVTEPVQLVTAEGKANPSPVNVVLRNRQLVEITVNKEFWDASSTGTMTKNTAKTTDITLYAWDGTAMTAVSTQQGGSVTWEDLPLYDGDTKLAYYVTEDAVDGYALDASTAGTVFTVEGDTNTYLPVSVSGVENTKNLYNVQQLVPVVIYKQNAYTKKFMAGAKVSAKVGTEVAVDSTGTSITDREILSSDGLVMYLQPGKSYTFTETVVPANTESMTGAQTVDLTNAAPVYNTNHTCEVKTLTFKNRPYPTVRAYKLSAQKNASGTNPVITAGTVEFTLYEQLADGSFAPVKAGDPRIVYAKAEDQPTGDAANAPLVIKNSSGYSTYRIKPGRYYLAEKTTPAGYVDVNKVPVSVLTDAGNKNVVQGVASDDGKTYNFFGYEVVNSGTTDTSTADNRFNVTVYNIPNKGKITVEKWVDGALAKLADFPIEIRTADGTVAASGVTDSTGKVTLEVPAYDTDTWQPITYTIVEGDIPSKYAHSYNKLFDGMTVAAQANKTVTKDAAGTTLHVENKPLSTAKVHKIYQHTWEWWNTQQDYNMGQVVIGLYAKQADGTWKMVSSSTTDNSGMAYFDELDRDTEYALVERSCSDPCMYPYMNGETKAYATADVLSSLDGYSYKIIYADSAEHPRKPETDCGTMINRDNWVKFNITKWLDDDLHEEGGEFGSYVDYEKDKKLNGAVFRLFRKVMPAGQTEANFSLSTAAADGWTVMGTYTSGQAYGFDALGNWVPKTGMLATDVDQKAGKNVIYMMVELNAGPSGVMIQPNMRYTLYRCSGTDYDVTIPENYTLRKRGYTLNRDNFDDILNCLEPGPSTGALMQSAIRLSKWKDDIDEDGEYLQEYKPLLNTTFDIYLDADCTTLLETVTTGLNNEIDESSDAKATSMAQSSIYSLSITGNPLLATTGSLVAYADPNSETGVKEFGTVELTHCGQTDDYMVFGIPVYVKEMSAPKGFSVSGEPLAMWMYFVDYFDANTVNPTTYSDAFYVMSDTEDLPLSDTLRGTVAGVATWEKGDSTESFTATGKYRIVDYPMQDTKVTIAKYGYTPTADTVGKTAEELDEMDIDTVPMAGVKMTIERQDPDANNAWKAWGFMTQSFGGANSFTIRADGTYTFAKGLPEGVYRVKETSLGTTWSAGYENAYGTNNTARIFTVGTEGRVISMYNPTKASMKITKKNYADTALTGVTFKLTDKSNSSNVLSLAAVSGEAGSYQITNIPSGTYTLTESMSGYASTYLTKYIKTLNNAKLDALVSSAGTLVGVEFGTAGTSTERDTVVKTLGLNDENIEFTVKNPLLVNFSVTKVDEADETKKLGGAVFTIWRKAFDNVNGNTAVTVPANPTASTWGNGWTKLQDVTTNATTGIGSVTGKYPGIYAFVEKTAPAGYDILKDVNGKPIVYYVVATGGMPVTVTGLPATATVTNLDSTTGTVQTLFNSTTGTAGVTAPNRAQKGLTVQKTVESGEVDADTLTWRVKVDLYDAAAGGNLVGTATLSNTTPGPVSFMKPGTTTPVTLSHGVIYYAAESVVSPTKASDYVLNGFAINGVPVTAAGGRYPVTLDPSGNTALTLTNTYMRGQVVFTKRDADDKSKLLSGAAFTVCTKNAEGKNVALSGAKVTELKDAAGKGTGIYSADIPLKSAEETTYYVVETSAPDGYIMPRGGLELPVTLSAENNVEDWRSSEDSTRYLENKKGWNLTVTKIGNIEGASKAPVAGAGDATFTLYRYDEDNELWSVVEAKQTDANGQVKWLLNPGDTYAYYETGFNTGKYVGIDGFYTAGGDRIAEDQFTTIKIGTAELPAIKIANVSADMEIRSYNRPLMKIKVVKKDAGGYPANVQPMAEYAIYELSEALPASRTQALNAIADLAEETPVYTGSTVYVDTDGFSTYEVVESVIDPDKRYVIVETEADSKNDVDYDTLNKADKRVVWYKEIAPMADPDPDTVYEYVLENIYGDAQVTLTKAVDYNKETSDSKEAADTDNAVIKSGSNYYVESLLTGSRKVRYTVTPTVTGHNQPLKSFKVSDTGLTFAPAGNNASYAITGITVGKASHDPQYVAALTNTAVAAEVTWLKGTETISTVTTDALTEARTLTAPEGATAFTVDYCCDALKTATDGMYALGEAFTCDPITVNVLVDQQADGTADSPVIAASKFTNTAKTTLVYPKWAADGSGTTDKSETKTASAAINVRGLSYPVVSITKTADPANKVDVDGTVQYTLLIENKSATEPFIDPVIFDLLPTGVHYDGGITLSDGANGEKFTYTVGNYVGAPTLTYQNESGQMMAGEGETAMVVRAEGTLEPGSSFTVTYRAKVGSATILYGNDLYNYAFLSSSHHTFHTKDNPQGISFRLNDTTFPGNLPTEASKNLTGPAATRLGGMSKILASYMGDDYAWVKSEKILQVTASTSLTLTKFIQGDKDSGFSSADGFIATATRTNSTGGDETTGYVDYELCVTNGTSTAKSGLVIGDAISKVGDGRGSKWNVIWDSLTGIVFDNTLLTPNDYTVFYYTGTPESAEGAVGDALDACSDWANNRNWLQTGNSAPAGWTSTLTASQKKDVTGFIIIFPAATELEPDKSIYIIYHTTTEDITSDTEFGKVAYENAINTFYTDWAGNGDALRSNPVAVQLASERVSVHGDLWIDEDWDGVQGITKDGQTVYNPRDYSKYAIVKAFADAMTFHITDLRKTVSGTDVDTDKGGSNTYKGDSVKHFSFEDLGAALHLENKGAEYVSNQLNVKSLKTDDPYNYSLTAQLDTSMTDLLEIFKLTNRGTNHYLSDDMTDTGAENRPQVTDSNFAEKAVGTYTTLPFYLHASGVDMTKDIGFRMERDLMITKLAADDANVRVEGATFNICGPLEEGAAANASASALKFTAVTDTAGNVSYKLDPQGSVTDLTTDANGALRVTGLNWWKEYNIVEVGAGAGYQLEGASAAAGTGSAITAITDAAKPTWRLKVPGTDRVTKTDSVTVTNVRSVEAELRVTKSMLDPNGAKPEIKKGDFSFNLYNATDNDPIQTKANDEDGVAAFDALTFTKPGDYTFTVEEVIPADADKLPNVTYTDEVLEVTVQVRWSTADKKLTANVIYGDQDGTFVNGYIPTPVELALPVQKVIEGVTPPTGKTFTFKLEPADETNPAPMPVVNGKTVDTVSVTGAGKVSFPAIAYEKVGTYTYKLTETVPADKETNYKGYTFDTQTYTVTVTVTGADGELSAEYAMNADKNQAAKFTNTYIPLPTTLDLGVTKTVSGDKTPADKKFTFKLAAATTGAPMPTEKAATTGTDTVVDTVEVYGSDSGAFPTISYTAAGVYEYDLTEVVPANAEADYPGYTFTTVTFHAKVTVTNDDGQLKAAIVWTKIDGTEEEEVTAPEFINEYEVVPTQAAIALKKEVTGAARLNKDKKVFTFTLAALNGAPLPIDPDTEEPMTSIRVKDGETVTLPVIPYTAAGTYNYTVTEVKPDDADTTFPGYGFDTKTHTVEITVTDTDHVLVPTVKVDGVTQTTATGVVTATVTVSNTYTVTGTTIDLPIEKAIEGKTPPTKKQFTFIMTPVDGAPMPEGTVNGQKSVTVQQGTQGLFGDIAYTAAGTYTYNVTEFKPADAETSYPAYGFDAATHTYVVTVVDNGSKLSATFKADGGQTGAPMIITNTYIPGGAFAQIPVKKTVNGIVPSNNDKTFTFTIAGKLGTEPLPEKTDGTVVTSIDVVGGATGQFPLISYDTAGVYEYIVKETIPTDKDTKYKGYTFDTKEHAVTVTVTDTAGKLSAAYAVAGTTDTFVEIVNTYVPSTAAFDLDVTKSVTGEPRPSDDKKEFTFTLAGKTGDEPMPADGKAQVKITDNGSAAFDTITYTAAGIYEYTVTETQPASDTYTVVKGTHTVTVTVTDHDGTLKAAAQLDNGTPTAEAVTVEATADMVNKYTPKAATQVLKVRKTMNGDIRPEAWKQTFTFTLAGKQGTEPMPIKDGAAVTTVDIKDNGEKSFPAITYTSAGTYEYTLVEEKKTVTGYTFDTTTHSILVTVTDNKGQLVAAATEGGKTFASGEFVNSYLPEPTDMPLAAQKFITGKTPKADYTKQFTFDLTAKNGAPLPGKNGETCTSVTVTGAAKDTFGTIHFEHAGTYEYTLKEQIPTDKDTNYKGYTFDTDEHTITVTVTDTDGKLSWSCVIDANDAVTSDPTVAVTNPYNYLPTTLALPVKKGFADTCKFRPSEKEFKFLIEAETDGAPMPAKTTAGVIGAAEGTFDAITYTEEGEWTYKITEIDTNETGYIYSTAAYLATVTVTDVDGQLVAEWTSDVLGTDDPMVFINDYQPIPTEASLTVTKVVDGHDRPDFWQQTFDFVLTGKTGTEPMPEDGKDTVSIKDNGEIAFADITYDTAGEYEYELTETQVDVLGYTYDAAKHTVKVIITDNDGELETAISLDGEAAITTENNDGVVTANTTFTNTYIPTAIKAQLPVKKELAGDPTPTDKEFTFVLAARNTEPMPAAGEEQVTVIGAAEDLFGEIEFTAAGIYTYDVTEIPGTDYGYGYDAATHTYTVEIIDEGGHLEAYWKVDDTDEDTAVFTNLYTPDGTTLAIPVEKVLVGQTTPTDKAFTFTLTPVTENAPMPESDTVTVIGAGTSAFGLIDYEHAGVYEYTVTEVAGSDTGYTYDDTVITVTVTVTDTEAVLSAAYTVDYEPGIVFTNTYIPVQTEVILPVVKEINGPVPQGSDKVFTFQLAPVTEDAPMPETAAAEVTGAGSGEFGSITYTTAGTWEYTVTETVGSDTGYTYDTMEYTVTVTVTDEDGELKAEYTLSEGTELVFSNGYTPEPTTFTLSALKVLKNLKLEAGMFEFVLTDASGAELQTALNKADGTVTFEPIEYTEAGEYTYRISERKGGMARVKYDENVYTVKVMVTDEDGKLTASADVTAPTFENEYEPEIPSTGYGPNNTAWILGLLALALAVLVLAARKRESAE